MIKGLSEKEAKLVRLGKIRLGEKTSNGGKEYPRQLGYFLVKEEKNTPKSNLDAFRSVYGEKPCSLDIMFASDDIEQVFPQFLKYYGQAGLLCKGDGEKAQCVHKETGEMVETECRYKECKAFKAKKCRPVANLMFMLPKVPGVGVWQIDTSSIYSILQINSQLATFKSIFGRLRGIPLMLEVVKKEVKVEDKTREIYILNLNTEKSLTELMQKKSMNKSPSMPSLPLTNGKDDVDHDDDLGDFDESDETDETEADEEYPDPDEGTEEWPY